MPPIRPAQTSFSGGEVSPALYARTDIQKYQTSVKSLRNMIIHPTGGISNRPGTYFVANAKSDSNVSRVVPFVFSLTQAYVLEFGNQCVRFYTDGAQITTAPSTAYEVSTPYLEADLFDLRFESSADTIYITHPSYQTRTLSRIANTNWELALYEPQDGPFMLENVDESISLNVSAVTGAGVSLIASSALFDSDHVGSLWKLRHYVQEQAVSASLGSATTTSSISCFTTWRIITHGTWTGKLRIEKSTDGGTTWTSLRTFSSADDFNANTSGTEDPEIDTIPFLIRANMYSYTSGTCNVDLTADAFYQEGIVEFTTYLSTTAAQVEIIDSPAATTNTTAWAEGAWSAQRGFPRVARFYQDRLVFAGTNSEPQTNWMTRIGDYTSFGRNQISLLDTDGISVNLPTRTLNAVNGLVALRKLIAFTSATEWAIGPVEGSVLTPTSVSQEVQGYNGSSGIEPVVIGNQAVYVQGRGTVVRNIGFQLQDDGFVGNELNILAKHLFDGHDIVEMAYQQEPDRIVWCLRDDGVLLALTYMPEQEVVAWARHETEGVIESVCVIPATGYDEVWLAVERDGNRFIERMAQRLASTEVQDWYFVDCGLTYEDTISISSISSAAEAVVTIPTGHGLTNGDPVDITDVEGLLYDGVSATLNGTSAINEVRFTVGSATATTIKLLDEDGDTFNSSALTAYISGGYIRPAYTEFSGLDHLNGYTVAILGDGDVYPEDDVAGGTITLSNACSRVHIGLPYTADLETLNIEIPLRDGTMQGKKVKISNVLFRLVNSRGGWIGPDEDTLHEAFTPTRLSLGDVAELYTGDVREPLGASYSDGGRIFFRQVDPLPVTITSLVPEVTPGGMGA